MNVATARGYSCSVAFLFRLTAFVYKTFARALAYIFIDLNVQRQTYTWLASKQRSDGCFQSVGENFNNALQVITSSHVIYSIPTMEMTFHCW